MQTAKDENIRTPIMAMIDIVFLLIIFFVVTSEIQQDVVDTTIKLAQSHHVKPQGKDLGAITINIKRRLGAKRPKISIAGMSFKTNELEAFLKNSRNRFGNEIPIIVRASGKIKYREVDKVMQAIGRAGLYRVSVASLDVGKH